MNAVRPICANYGLLGWSFSISEARRLYWSPLCNHQQICYAMNYEHCPWRVSNRQGNVGRVVSTAPNSHTLSTRDISAFRCIWTQQDTTPMIGFEASHRCRISGRWRMKQWHQHTSKCRKNQQGAKGNETVQGLPASPTCVISAQRQSTKAMKMLRCTLGVLRPVFARQACLRVAGYQSATDAAAEQAQLVADRKGKRRVTELFDRYTDESADVDAKDLLEWRNRMHRSRCFWRQLLYYTGTHSAKNLPYWVKENLLFHGSVFWSLYLLFGRIK